MQLSDNARGALYMSVAMATFTLNDACMKAVAQTLPLQQSIFLRGLLTTLALLALGWHWGTLSLRVEPGDRKWLALRTMGEVGGTLTFLSALRHMPLANLSSILQFLPLAVTLGAALLLRERVGWRRFSAILVGFLGVLLIVRPGTEGFDRWSLVGIASVACVVLRDLATRRMSSALSSVTVAVAASSSVTVMGAALIPFDGWGALTPASGGLIAAASTFLIAGYLLIIMAMRVGEISLVAPFRYTALVFAIGLGWAAFDQWPDGFTLTGAVIVILTGIYSFHRERKIGRSIAMPTKAPLRLR